jgi:hypothetical protein
MEGVMSIALYLVIALACACSSALHLLRNLTWCLPYSLGLIILYSFNVIFVCSFSNTSRVPTCLLHLYLSTYESLLF